MCFICSFGLGPTIKDILKQYVDIDAMDRDKILEQLGWHGRVDLAWVKVDRAPTVLPPRLASPLRPPPPPPFAIVLSELL